MRIATTLVVCMAVAAMGSLSSCKSTDQPGDTGGIHMPDYTGQWTLQSVEGVWASSIVGDGRVPDMQIARDGQVTGFAGINRMSGTFDPNPARGEPLFGPMITTKMAGPEHLMALESRVLAALAEARVASIEAGNLALFAEDGRELAVFAPGGGTR